MRQQPSTQEQTTLKDRILQAAIAEFATSGYHLTAMRVVAERSGSNKPMVYYHFQGKEGLYLAACRLLLEETAERLREATRPEAPALERLRRYAEVYLDAFLLSRPMLGTALRELNSLVTPLYLAIMEMHARLITAQLRRILAEGIEAGEFRRLDLEGCIGGISAILHGFVRHRLSAPDQRMRAALSQLMDYYAVGLLTREGAVNLLPHPAYENGVTQSEGLAT